MTKKEYEKVLELFTDITAGIRIGTTSDVVRAVSQGEISVDEQELPRLVALLETLIDTYAANGFEQVQRVLRK